MTELEATWAGFAAGTGFVVLAMAWPVLRRVRQRRALRRALERRSER